MKDVPRGPQHNFGHEGEHSPSKSTFGMKAPFPAAQNRGMALGVSLFSSWDGKGVTSIPNADFRSGDEGIGRAHEHDLIVVAAGP
jgi:hypothetical protein